MEEFKIIIKNFIVLAVIFQLGGVILSKTRFFKNYKKISGIILTICLISSFMKLDLSFDNIKIPYNEPDENYENTIKVEFQNKLKEMIENDLHNKYYVNVNVDVSTNYESVRIIISGNISDNEKITITNYIKTTYCTPKDEVIINGENT